MKIVHIITLFDTVYGAQTHVLDVSEGLMKEGHQVSIITGTTGTASEKAEGFGINVMKWKTFRHSINPFYDIKMLIKLITYLKSENPDIVASHSSKAGIISRIACWWCKVPNTFTAHGWSFEDGIPYVRRKIFLLIEKLIGLISYKIIVVSEAGREIALSNNIVPERKIALVYSGVKDKNINAAKVDYKIFTMLMVAGLRPQKDHSTLLRALSKLKDYQWQIFFLGDGELENAIKKESIDLNISERTHFMGAVNNVHDYYNSVDLMVLTTHWEGMPISILEALPYSLPMLATDVAGVKEEVVDMYNGKLLRRLNVEDAYNGVKYFLDNTDKLLEMGTNSRRLFEEKFKIDYMVKATLNVYNSILRK